MQVILEETGATISTTQSSKPKERKVTIKADKISRYFTEDYSSEDIENIIYQLLEEWQNKQ